MEQLFDMARKNRENLLQKKQLYVIWKEKKRENLHVEILFVLIVMSSHITSFVLKMWHSIIISYIESGTNVVLWITKNLCQMILLQMSSCTACYVVRLQL